MPKSRALARNSCRAVRLPMLEGALLDAKPPNLVRPKGAAIVGIVCWQPPPFGIPLRRSPETA
jgi:hypothetical protein